MAEILLLEADPALRAFEYQLLRVAGYIAREIVRADAAIDILRFATAGHVVVCGNADVGHRQLILPFFSQVAQIDARERPVADPPRHRYICLTTVPEHLPQELAAIFRRLQVRVLKKPFYPDELLAAVSVATAQLAG